MLNGAKLKSEEHYAAWLWLLSVLFCLRVAAQLVALNASLPFIPAFDAWHSATIPYWLLLASQLLILVVMAAVAWRFSSGNVQRRPFLGQTVLTLGAIYFGVMLARLALGTTVFAGHPWFGKILPTVFHLVLATFLLIVGWYHIGGRTRARR